MSAHRFVRWQEDSGNPQVSEAGLELLIVEDTPETQRWLAAVLDQAFPASTVVVASSVRAAMSVISGRSIDIALIDLGLPDGSGIEVIQELTISSPFTRSVITTIFDDDEHLMPGLAAGALGYLLKDQPEAVLIEQLRLLADGVPPLAPSVARRLVRHFAERRAGMPAQPAAPAMKEDDLPGLSNREAQVLSLIAKGLQIADVAQALAVSAHTVCSHIKNIYRKRNVCSRAEAALEARRLGLV